MLSRRICRHRFAFGLFLLVSSYWLISCSTIFSVMLDCNYLVSKYPRDFNSSMLLDLAEMLLTLLLEPPNLSIPTHRRYPVAELVDLSKDFPCDSLLFHIVFLICVTIDNGRRFCFHFIWTSGNHRD